MRADWTKVRVKLGQWSCWEHGVIEPEMEPLPHCTEVTDDGTQPCMRLATEAVLDARRLPVHLLPSPEFCDGPDHHPRGAMTTSRVACRCTPAGAHDVWICTVPLCGSRVYWPPVGAGPGCELERPEGSA